MTASYHRLFKLLFLTTVLCASACANAQQVFDYGPFTAQRYTEADGLVSAETVGSFRDVHGFLWIATFNGLSRFDGRNFQNFGRQSGLQESNVDLLGEDSSGQLFVRSVSAVYRYTGNGTRPFLKYPASGRFIAAACPTGNGGVWLAYEGQTGLHLYTPGGEAARLPTAAPVYQMVQGGPGEIYVLELGGKLSLLKAGRLQQVYTVRALTPYQNEGVRLYKDGNGRVWTYGANNRFLSAHNGGAIADSVAVPAATPWWQWAIGSAGNIYLTHDSGSLAQLMHGRWQNVLTKAQIRGHVYEVKEDSDGTLWVCSSNGLLRIRRKQYQNFTTASPASYFAVDAKGRYVLRSDSLLFSIPRAVQTFYQLQPKTVTNVYVTRKKDVWYCTEEAVYCLPYGAPLQRLNTANTYEGTNAVFRFRRVLEDDKGGFWISSYHGIFYKRGDSLRYYFNREGLTEGAIYSIALDRDGVLYASGVNVYAFTGQRFQNISSGLHLPNEISRLATDENKAVWVCQEGTARTVRIGAKGGRFYRTDSVELSLNGAPFAATSVCFDAQNNLWACDNRAMYCFRYGPNGYAASPLYFDENLSGSPLLYADDNGHLQVLSHPLADNYLRTYKVPALLAGLSATPPHLLLTGVRLFKQDVDWAERGFATNTLGIPDGLRLKHNQNFLQFFFTGLTDNYSRNVVYRYRMAGYDQGWSPVTARGEAEYTGLPSGSYTLEVQARNAGGNWSQPLTYSFTVDVVWYRTWWATFVWVLLALNAFIAVLHWRSRSQERKARVKQLLVEEQLKALRAQINPHFLQNTFAFLAHELYASQNTRAIKALDRLSAYLRDVLRFSDKTAITLEEELVFAEEYLQMQQQLLRTRFWYTVAVADDVDLFDVQVPSMLLQPILENALKYGMNPDAQNSIQLALNVNGPYIECTVSDSGGPATGAGFSLQKAGTGKGLSLTQERLKLFYSNKKHPPQFSRTRNARGGTDVRLLLPVT